MTARSTQEFQNKVLKKMTFTPYEDNYCTIYTNKDKQNLGYFIKYSREGYYDFGIGDYTIPENFSLSFDHEDVYKRQPLYFLCLLEN